MKIGNVVRVEAGRVDVFLTVRDLNLEHDARNYRVGQLGSYVTIPLDNLTKYLGTLPRDIKERLREKVSVMLLKKHGIYDGLGGEHGR